jgi:hypothetical protein
MLPIQKALWKVPNPLSSACFSCGPLNKKNGELLASYYA